MPADWEATSVHNLVRTLDFVRAPFLHGRAVYGLSLMLQVLLSAIARVQCSCWAGAYVKCHPADGLIFGNLCLFHQLEFQCLVVERDRDNNTWRRPRADHKMMFDHVASS
jgi:hypothetical protein